jgi:hypothetical protein
MVRGSRRSGCGALAVSHPANVCDDGALSSRIPLRALSSSAKGRRRTLSSIVALVRIGGRRAWSEHRTVQQGVARPEEREDLRSFLLRRIAVLCPFVGSAVGSRCLTARGYKKEIEWVLERDGWSTFGILT